MNIKISVVANKRRYERQVKYKIMREDELLHFLICLIASTFVLLSVRIKLKPFRWIASPMHNWDAGIATLIGIVIALAKEIIFDGWIGLGQPQFYDAFWGICGAIAGPMMILLLEGIIVEWILKKKDFYN